MLSDLHHSLKAFLTSLNFTDVTLNKSLVLLILSWCLIPWDHEMTNILWDDYFFTFDKRDRKDPGRGPRKLGMAR